MSLLILWFTVLPLQSLGYPAWFWEMPPDSTATYAVGYARRFTRIDTSFAYARRDGLWQLVRSLGVTIESSQALFNQFGQNKLVGLQEAEMMDSTLAATVQGRFQIVDSAVVGDLVIALAAFSGAPEMRIDKTRLPPANKPAWVDVTPRSDTFIYAVGTAPLYFYEQHSWERAEASARIQLAFLLETKTRSVNWKEKASLQTWSETSVSIKLKNVTVARRWLDCINRQCFVLCQMPF
jgi:hypothetical protein